MSFISALAKLPHFISLQSAVFIMLSPLFLLLQISSVLTLDTCSSSCTAAPPTDCVIGGQPPLQGGPACSCVQEAPLPGCILKPCQDQSDREFCDSSAGYGSVASGRLHAFAHKCTVDNDGCECCSSYPVDCTYDNLFNPPANGGPPCSCASFAIIPGCTLKPCRSEVDDICVCNSRFTETHTCFGSLCPGNNDAGLVGDCSIVNPTTTNAPISTTTKAPDSTTTRGPDSTTTKGPDSTTTSDPTTTIKTCSSCTAAPPNDCVSGGQPPLQGGPACSCVQEAPLPGCILKPCQNQDEREYCDSSAGYGSVTSGRLHAFAHKCTDGKDGCECCSSYPVDCTYESLNNPPANGGPPCSCISLAIVPGCTLKPCQREEDNICVCNSRFTQIFTCFGSLCPGNNDAGLVGDCNIEPTTTTKVPDPTTTRPPDSTTTREPDSTTTKAPETTTTNVPTTTVKTCSSSCTAVPSNDCVIGGQPPLQGGPACSCVQEAPLPGCILKPCQDQSDREFCDSSAGYGSVASGRLHAFAHKCVADKEGCECCSSYPVDCTYDNLFNPPANGGPPCSCVSFAIISGCTLKPCRSEVDDICVCNSRFTETHTCFASVCPGNNDAGLVGDCVGEISTTFRGRNTERNNGY